ncbi:hypothetical protein [Luteimicrobium subarcticum]|uniref:Uncharacterized protein n=1 Tax=Luteimicrobium subarcticum TaxID=620910 RepID=A0A2M8WSY2_9MICO|nr:hypothetical protein [Luteimicrobium subarcticum]PJI94039.1 hypothetical protein CLV34_1523 [Luteimicrobium subarcticum]
MTSRRTADDPLAWAAPGSPVAYVDDAHPGVVEPRTVARTTGSSIVTSDGERWRRRALQSSGPWAGALVVLSGTRAKRLAPWDHPQVVALSGTAAAPATSPPTPPTGAPADGAADDGVPWGRRPVPDIPVPPFRTAEDAVAFVTALGTWVAALGTPDVGLAHTATLAVLDAERDRLGRDGTRVEQQPAPTVLRVALATFFPAPWTPVGLVHALTAAGLGAGPLTTAGSDRILWGGDPDFTARRAADGSWDVERHERGRTESWARAADDDDLVLLLEREHRDHFPYPLGRRVDDDLVTRLRAAAAPTLRAWSEHAGLPYLARWRRP